MKKYILLLILLFIFTFVFSLEADTIYLKNGRSIVGIIKGDDDEELELEVSGGSVKFAKILIDKVSRSSQEEINALRQEWEKNKIAAEEKADALRQEWERNKILAEEKIAEQQRKEEGQPRVVKFLGDSNKIIVNTTLNNKVKAALVLDTGATLTMISRGVAEKLGLKLGAAVADIKVQLADGRQVKAKYIVLKTVKVENSEAQNVDASILLDEGAGIPYDGLLGMSFLKKFNFKIDLKEKRLTLEKL